MNLEGNQASIRDACDAGLLAGAVTVVWQHGEVLQANGIGYRDIDANLPMQRDTLFRIASMTKPVTVAAAMSLVDEGKLALRDPIVRWLPEFADAAGAGRPERTAGSNASAAAGDPGRGPAHPYQRPGIRILGGRSDIAGLRSAAVRARSRPWLAALAELPLVHQPGERLTYGHGIDVVGVLVSRIEGKPFHEVLDERILHPLGMFDTGFFVSVEGRRRAATMYRLDDQDRLQHDVMGQPHISPPAFCNAGGGLWSTADDYLRFIEMLMGDGTLDGVRVLSQESARLMRTDRLTDEQKQHSFLGAPFWIGRGFGLNLSVVTDPAKSAPLFGPGGARDVQLARRIRDVVAGRSGGRPHPAVPDPEHAHPVGRCRRGGRRQYVAREVASGATEIRAPHLSRPGL